jgi:hypothetical protein
MSGIPSIVQALLAMLLFVIGAVFIYLCRVLADSSIARHYLGLCNPGACQRCETEAINQRVSEYARQARERRLARG